MISSKKEAEDIIKGLNKDFKEVEDEIVETDDLCEMHSCVFRHLPTDKLYCIDYYYSYSYGIDAYEVDGKWAHEAESYTIVSIGYRRKECEEKLSTSSQK